MKARTIFICLSVLLITGSGQTVAPLSHANYSVSKASIVANYGRLPLTFEANQGQVDAMAKFFSRGAGYSVFLTRDEAVLALRKTGNRNRS
jgi:hypothetical protein